MPIRVLLVDDHSLLRQGLKALLQMSGEFEVVGEAPDGRAAVNMIASLMPDVVIMDLRMPHLHGVEATRQIMQALPSTKVIGLSGQADNFAAREILHAGATGFLLKEAAFEELATAIRTVVNNKLYLSPSISSIIINEFVGSNSTTPDRGYGRLSPREREILQLLAEGQTTKEVALSLSVSVKTVETHRRNIMQKIQANGIADLTKYAIREGIVSV